LAVLRPSDAPGDWRIIHDLEGSISDQDMYIGNTERTMPLLDSADNALGSASEILKRARELAVQMASETYSDADRTAAAVEIDALREDMLSLGNTEHAGRYMFAGTAYDTPPFLADGTYVGAASVPSVQVGRDTWVESGFEGGAIFASSLTALEDLAAAMRSGPGSADLVAAAIDPIDVGLTDVLDAFAKTGLAFNRADDAAIAAGSAKLLLQGQLDDTVGADPVEAYTEFANLAANYQAALQVSASTLGLDLFDYI
jgi:flagellar hook-associated protein 3 FlgL